MDAQPLWTSFKNFQLKSFIKKEKNETRCIFNKP